MELSKFLFLQLKHVPTIAISRFSEYFLSACKLSPVINLLIPAAKMYHKKPQILFFIWRPLVISTQPAEPCYLIRPWEEKNKFKKLLHNFWQISWYHLMSISGFMSYFHADLHIYIYSASKLFDSMGYINILSPPRHYSTILRTTDGPRA